MDRREFMKGAALGVGAGVLGSMGLYSYSPLRRAFLPEVKRGTEINFCGLNRDKSLFPLGDPARSA